MKHLSKPLSFWESVLFSDESKFDIHKSDGHVVVWRKPNQQMLIKSLCGTVKHDEGEIVVWRFMRAARLKMYVLKKEIWIGTQILIF